MYQYNNCVQGIKKVQQFNEAFKAGFINSLQDAKTDKTTLTTSA